MASKNLPAATAFDMDAFRKQFREAAELMAQTTDEFTSFRIAERTLSAASVDDVLGGALSLKNGGLGNTPFRIDDAHLAESTIEGASLECFVVMETNRGAVTTGAMNVVTQVIRLWMMNRAAVMAGKTPVFPLWVEATEIDLGDGKSTFKLGKPNAARLADQLKIYEAPEQF